ncbi:hypothetical protein NYR54_17850 [Chelativorans sp. SCAU2101]|uniref:Uncharacterized protein n=1 Tax=Chelativorans petroleitrophicus TaxID=2975484 RepID=A0A9X2XCM9_9HYPH|nr:hypothetical protein [Chelativorans petroleitrophicus]MCT8992130.1 hypothetical protein [Chelativorans petroleitrophicus]
MAVLIGFSGIIAVEAQTAAEVNKTLDELFGEHAPYQAFFEKLKKAVVWTAPRCALGWRLSFPALISNTGWLRVLIS